MSRFRLMLILCSISLVSGCATPVAVPRASLLEEKPAERYVLSQYTPPPASVKPASLPDGFRVSLPNAGDMTLYGFRISPELAATMAAVASGDLDSALTQLERQDGAAAGDKLQSWFLSSYRAHLLNLAGRSAEAETELVKTRQREIELRGADIVSRTLRGDAHVRLGEIADGLQDYLSVMRALDGWMFPTSFAGPPSNRVDMALTTEAKTRALLGIGVALVLDGRYAEALPWLEAAESHLSDIFQVMAHPLYRTGVGKPQPDLYLARGTNLAFLAVARRATQKPEAEIAAAEQGARSHFDAIGFAQGHVYLDGLTAKALFDTRQVDAALEAGNRAALSAEQQGLPDFVWRIQAAMGEGLFAAGRFPEAESALRKAQMAVDRIVGTLGRDREKRRFGVGKEIITRYLTDIDFRQGNASRLFEDLERGRARAFVDLLGQVKWMKNRPELARVERLDQMLQQSTLAREIAYSGGQLRNLQVDSVKGQRPEARLDSALSERQDEADRIARRSPQLADGLQVTAPKLADVERTLQPGQFVVYWLPVADKAGLRALVIGKDGTDLREFELTAEQLRAWLARFGGAVRSQDDAAQRKLAQELSSRLNVAKLTSASTTYMIPSGDMHLVPWGALEIGGPVSVLPTAAWLLRSEAIRLGENSRAVIVGDPDFHGKLPQLPGSRAEAGSIKTLYREPAVLLGSDATAANLRDQVGASVDVLHLATHGKYFANRPLDSAIYLSAANGAEALSAGAIFERPLPARLVVLSACETGIGEAVAGDDLLGLARSFYLGGSGAILNSLWEVDDEGTAQFMHTFHAAARGNSLPAAWLKARNALRKQGAAPWIYGAFSLGGAR